MLRFKGLQCDPAVHSCFSGPSQLIYKQRPHKVRMSVRALESRMSRHRLPLREKWRAFGTHLARPGLWLEVPACARSPLLFSCFWLALYSLSGLFSLCPLLLTCLSYLVPCTGRPLPVPYQPPGISALPTMPWYFPGWTTKKDAVIAQLVLKCQTS